MRKNMLLEIGTEEVPAEWLKDIATQLKDKICALLKSYEISYDDYELFYTPRRIAVIIKNVATEQNDKYVEITGPPKEVAITNDNDWSEAAIGFAKAQSIPVKELKFKLKGKKEVVSCEKLVKGSKTQSILKSNLSLLISKIEFPKSMVWEITEDRRQISERFRFVRPIRWVVALFGETIIPFEMAGIKAGRKIQGLRGTPAITIKNPTDYEKLLNENGIIANPNKREDNILKSIHNVRKEKGIPDIDATIWTQILNLVECPKVILGKFNEKYLNLPKEVIITAMKSHQKYLPLREKDGSLASYFIIVANTKDGDIDKIRGGNERVLRARLEDAEFYYKEDMKIRLEDRIEELKGVTWQEGLGTLYDKSQRLIKLSKYIAEKYVPDVDLALLEKAAKLCKVDLMTNMIKDGKEFTTLEGLYGSILAEKQGVEHLVSLAIKGHSSLVIPTLVGEPETVVLAITDRIDTIVGAFLLGKIPTGSKDPLGIKRAGNELIDIIIKNSISLQIKELIEKSIEGYMKQAEVKERILEFFIQRGRKYLEDEGIRYDIIDAVIGVPNDDLVDLYIRANMLNGLKAKMEFGTLATLAKRVRNILESSKSKIQSPKCKKELLKEQEEIELYERLIAGEKDFEAYLNKRKYNKTVDWLITLAPVINNFFDKVLVMAPEVELRENRIALLHYLHSFFYKIADFSKIG